MSYTYFDHNASTTMPEAVIAAMLPYYQQPGNAASTHQMGRLMRHAINEAKEKIAQLVNAHPNEIIFTSGGTEANNLAILGWAQAQSEPVHLLVGSTEHDSVLQPAAYCAQKPENIVDIIPVDQDGVLLHSELWDKLTNKNHSSSLCSIMLANNESGTIQDIQKIAAHCHARGALVHTDAVQALGKMPVDFQALGVDLMTLSAHKIGGPKGVGVLVRSNHIPLDPIIQGGGHQQGLRAGTENVPGIVGFGKAAEIVWETLEKRQKTLKMLQQRLEQGLSQYPGIQILSHHVPRLSNTSLLVVPGIEGEMLLMQLDKKGFAVSSGSACHQETNTASHVLAAMKVPSDSAECVIRVSFGVDNTSDQVDNFLKTLGLIIGEVA